MGRLVVLLALLLSLVMLFPGIALDSAANPPPFYIFVPLPDEETEYHHPEGGPRINGNFYELRFISENVSVYISEDAHVVADYTFYYRGFNLLNCTVNLPFFTKPTDVKIMLENGTELEYEWTEYILTLSTEKHHILVKSSYHAIRFNMHFPSEELTTFYVEYNRPITRCICSDGVLNSFVYLCRTGGLWWNPIQYANFEFHVDIRPRSGRLLDNYTYEEILAECLGKLDTTMNISSSTELITDLWNYNGTHCSFRKIYRDWIPKKDIGIAWMEPEQAPIQSIGQCDLIEGNDQEVHALPIIEIYLQDEEYGGGFWQDDRDDYVGDTSEEREVFPGCEDLHPLLALFNIVLVILFGLFWVSTKKKRSKK